ncbi:hypothetical protein ACHAW5_007314 [Stephanodiscus triporus]|uniref:16S rRNA (uracil(1498)-N(3))-methyltransferase n=1 Tax=Stephanodiscus triporus TaxID=2934178 RepID=A0ABD3N8P1_9STRA
MRADDGGVKLVRVPGTIVQSTPMPGITLILAAPFPSRLRYLWPLMSSFAYVTRVIIVKSELSDDEYMKSSALSSCVYGPMILRGMSQGGRTRPVDVEICDANETITREWMERLGLLDSDDDDDDDDDDEGGVNENDGIARIFLDCGNEQEMPPPARNVVLERCGRRRCHAGGRKGRMPSAILAVGPERGWTDNEARVFVDECGFESATLGGSILRVDAAVVVGLGIVSAALDECHAMGMTGGGGSDDAIAGRMETSTRKRALESSPTSHDDEPRSPFNVEGE